MSETRDDGSAREPRALAAVSLRQAKCSVGCPVLDGLLRGGVPCGSVTELFGESGAGKTQLCLQLSLSALLPGASSLYLLSEPPFPLRRLRSLSLSPALPVAVPRPLDDVLVRPLRSAHDLLAVLERLRVAPPRPVRLIVVDSIAALFRSEFDSTAAALRARSSLLFRVGAGLKECAARLGAAVVVSNQVSDAPGGLLSSGRRVEAALGMAWANCVNTRVFLSKGVDGGRAMQVVFSPHLPHSSCPFLIRPEGVFGIT